MKKHLPNFLTHKLTQRWGGVCDVASSIAFH